MATLSFDVIGGFLLHSWQSCFQTVLQGSVLELDQQDSSLLASHLCSLLPFLSVYNQQCIIIYKFIIIYNNQPVLSRCSINVCSTEIASHNINLKVFTTK